MPVHGVGALLPARWARAIPSERCRAATFSPRTLAAPRKTSLELGGPGWPTLIATGRAVFFRIHFDALIGFFLGRARAPELDPTSCAVRVVKRGCAMISERGNPVTVETWRRTVNVDPSIRAVGFEKALVRGCWMRRNRVFDVAGYALLCVQRTESGCAQASMRLRAAQPMAASVRWAAKDRALSRRPISVL